MLWDEPARSQARTTAYVKRLCTSKDALRVFYSLVQAIPMSVYHVSSAKPPTPVGLHQRVQYIDAMYTWTFWCTECNGLVVIKLFGIIVEFYEDDFPMKETPEFFLDLLKKENKFLRMVDMLLKSEGNYVFKCKWHVINVRVSYTVLHLYVRDCSGFVNGLHDAPRS